MREAGTCRIAERMTAATSSGRLDAVGGHVDRPDQDVLVAEEAD